MNNYFEMNIKAVSENESFVRSTVASFAVTLSPTLDEINDIKTAVSEAVTNCIVHAYDGRQEGEIYIKARIIGSELVIIITDKGIGIENIEAAMTPFYTTKPGDERSGMGITLMQSFMDNIEITSQPSHGTTVTMTKKILHNKED